MDRADRAYGFAVPQAGSRDMARRTKKQNLTKLARNMRAYRALRAWTQQDLARESGVKKSTVSAIEIDDWTPGLAIAIRLADAFGVTLDELMGLSSPDNHPFVTTFLASTWATSIAPTAEEMQWVVRLPSSTWMAVSEVRPEHIAKLIMCRRDISRG